MYLVSEVAFLALMHAFKLGYTTFFLILYAVQVFVFTYDSTRQNLMSRNFYDLFPIISSLSTDITSGETHLANVT